MKTLTVITALLFILTISAQVNQSSTKVKGYNKKDGTHVNAYHRTKSNSTTRDNYSHKGNTNPYTGKKGSKK